MDEKVAKKLKSYLEGLSSRLANKKTSRRFTNVFDKLNKKGFNVVHLCEGHTFLESFPDDEGAQQHYARVKDVKIVVMKFLASYIYLIALEDTDGVEHFVHVHSTLFESKEDATKCALAHSKIVAMIFAKDI